MSPAVPALSHCRAHTLLYSRSLAVRRLRNEHRYHPARRTGPSRPCRRSLGNLRRLTILAKGKTPAEGAYKRLHVQGGFELASVDLDDAGGVAPVAPDAPSGAVRLAQCRQSGNGNNKRTNATQSAGPMEFCPKLEQLRRQCVEESGEGDGTPTFKTLPQP